MSWILRLHHEHPMAFLLLLWAVLIVLGVAAIGISMIVWPDGPARVDPAC